MIIDLTNMTLIEDFPLDIYSIVENKKGKGNPYLSRAAAIRKEYKARGLNIHKSYSIALAKYEMHH